jgi:hypothetical protein
VSEGPYGLYLLFGRGLLLFIDIAKNPEFLQTAFKAK